MNDLMQWVMGLNVNVIRWAETGPDGSSVCERESESVCERE